MWVSRCKYTGFCWELDGRLTGGTLFVPRILTFQMLKSKICTICDFNFRLESLTGKYFKIMEILILIFVVIVGWWLYFLTRRHGRP